jgi:hypothetical protein
MVWCLYSYMVDAERKEDCLGRRMIHEQMGGGEMEGINEGYRGIQFSFTKKSKEKTKSITNITV